MYETWGAFDINLLVWTETERVHRFVATLREQFPRSEVQLAAASRVRHHHGDEPPLENEVRSVLALAIQEEAQVPDVIRGSYLVSEFPAEEPERSIRAFTYVEAVEQYYNQPVRGGIIQHVRDKMLELLATQREHFPRLTTIEFAPDSSSKEMASTVLMVDFVAKEYRYLAEIPTRIIELGENAVRTVTCLETRRIVIQSDRLLL